MVRTLAGVVVVAALVPAAAAAPTPDEVVVGLHTVGIDVVAADSAAPTVGARSARHVALKNFRGFAYPYTSGWTRVGRVSVHLASVVRSDVPRYIVATGF